MGSLTEIVYSPLKEEAESLTGWLKTTIDYAVKNKNSLCISIKGHSKYHGRILDTAEVEDIYMELLDYLYHTDDYDLNKACTKSDYTSIVSLSGYVNTCVKYITLRSITNMYKYERHVVRDTVIGADGKELYLSDTQPDTQPMEQMESCSSSLQDICNMYEHSRYKFGTDIFVIWYVRLKTMECNKQDEYLAILKSIGISKHSVNIISRSNSIMLDIAKAITTEQNTATAIKILSQYVYGYEIIDRVIENC